MDPPRPADCATCGAGAEASRPTSPKACLATAAIAATTWRGESVPTVKSSSSLINRACFFDGYRRRGELIQPFDEDGWFATGDLGRVDDAGNLVFIERRAESIRVKGEFVPIGFVEEHFAKLPGIDDLAIWRQDSTLVDDEIALFVTGDRVDVEAINAARQQLPGFMRPSVVVRLKALPRDEGVGKVRRRELADAVALETVELM